MNPGHHIDYKQLRKINPEAARQAVLDYLESTSGNISQTARVFGINRCVVYDILDKQASGDLSDRPRIPKRQPNKTQPETEGKVIAAKNKTHLGSIRLSLYLAKYEQLHIPPGTIRHILQRNRHRLTYRLPSAKQRQIKREFVDWYNAKPFEIIQIDLKHIRDQ